MEDRSPNGLSNRANDGGSDDAQILDSSLTIDDGHIPAPAGHAPRLDVEQVDPDSTTLRVSEREREEAWIEYEPVGAV
ncbi:hypothetical protein DVK05_09700 [Halorubrum sp. Atlit-8R]|uniref:hypothetical protein n=1 Tax=Halorubrum sp. Atlit-8R TaxID=2282126 RepID=UPI000EF2092F|nr:hypothetical protein [Halorubrum sp. Atlit-8R]RLM81263.1 hypothetical protein DVK05_09700 [Halorubrum sp. Atlit-8R]